MVEGRRFTGRRVAKGVAILIMGAAAVALAGLVAQALWNALMPAIFGLKAIHFWQALGLLILGRLLFGGFHGHRGLGYRRRRRMLERWDRMSPEERERFRQGWRRCRGEGTN